MLPPVSFPTLGWIVCDWIETYLCHGPGDVQGQPWLPDQPGLGLDDEEVLFICWAYRVWPQGHALAGRRLVHRAIYSRPKGRRKSEIAGALMCAEALGPVRCDGFDAAGEPVGVPVTYPFIRCLATEEEQAGNTFDNVTYMLTHGEVCNEYAVDIGRSAETSTRVIIREPGGGEIIPSTAGAESKDGGKETAATADEPLALDTPIPTPDGWTTMGGLAIGDYVIGVDGQPILVWGVSPVKHGRDCYRVTFDDGTTIVADALHRWTVYDRILGRQREVTTREMVDAAWYGKARFAVPRPSPIELPDVDLPLDPWALGMWLGDGDARVATLAVGGEDLGAVTAELGQRGFETSVYHGRCNIVRFNHGRRSAKSGTSQSVLRELGLLRNKHVPAVYMRGGRAQRLGLLAGLMDSDGYVNERGNCTFTNVNRTLCEAVVELARSFGWRASIGAWQSDGRWKNRAAGTWRVSFTPSGDVPFRLARKAERGRLDRDDSTRAIKLIEPVPSVPVRCIAVDSDDHLFLAGPGMLPTHNTHLMVLPKLRSMYRTVARNTGKRKIADPWMLDTTTMYRVGENSVAEQAAGKYAHLPIEECVVKRGVLYDHRQGDEPKVFNDDRSLAKAMRAGYGSAAEWTDFHKCVRIVRDAEDPEEEAYRYYLNIERKSGSVWMAPKEIEATLDDFDVPAGSMVTLGFDGSENDDHTVLMGCTQAGDLFTVGAWTPGEEDGVAWRLEVDEAVGWAHDEFQVVLFYADPAYWVSELGQWAVEHGDHVREFWTGGRAEAKMAFATGTCRTALRHGAKINPVPLRTEAIKRGGKPLVQWHLENARTRKIRVRVDEQAQAEDQYLLRKERKGSPLKIDAATSSVLARRARDDAVKDGRFVLARKVFARAAWQ